MEEPIPGFRVQFKAAVISITFPFVVQSSEYIIQIQRRMFVSASPKETSEIVLSKPSKSECNTTLDGKHEVIFLIDDKICYRGPLCICYP